jgi:predicted transcriptional regulator
VVQKVNRLALRERRASAHALAQAGRGVNEIADELGVSRWTIRRDLTQDAACSAASETRVVAKLRLEIEAALAHPGELADAELTRLLLRTYKLRLLESGVASAADLQSVFQLELRLLNHETFERLREMTRE